MRYLKIPAVGAVIAMMSISNAQAGPLANAVSSADFAGAKKCLERGDNPNDADYRGKAAINIAAASDQFRMVEMLMNYGADIWATDELGRNVGSYTYFSRVADATDEGQARARVMDRLLRAGFPPPPFDPDDLQEMAKKGEWPPKGAKDSRGNPLNGK